MSDHWNSLADLLGTPSIDPPQKKSSPPPATEKEADRASSPSDLVSDDERPMSTHSLAKVEDALPETTSPVAKPDQPSRLRSTWDAVASLFGVAPVTEPLASTDEFSSPSSSSGPSSRSGPSSKAEGDDRSASRDVARRSKKKPPSFWDDSESESEDAIPPTAKIPVPRETKDYDPRPMAAENSGAVLPERSRRPRNIRRGQLEEPQESSRDTHAASESGGERQPHRDKPGHEPARPRSDRGAKTSEGERNVRRESSERSEGRSSHERGSSHDRAARPSQPRSRTDDRGDAPSERTSRPEKRSEIGTDDDLASSGASDRSSRSRERRDPPPREFGHRREGEPREEAEAWDTREIDFDQDESLEEKDLTVSPGDEGDASATSPRRRRSRRGRRRGSEKGERTTGDEARVRPIESDQDDEEAESIESTRVHKVTSWMDAISGMIQANMENHKRNPGHDRGRGGGSRRRSSGSGGSGGRRSP